MKKPEYQNFRWNCETLFCVEEFFKTASEEEKEEFSKLVAEGKLGISANYLNFNDLLDSGVYNERLQEWKEYFQKKGVTMKTAMFADINGIFMGCRDAMLDNGVEFLYTNIHCHHGMYPLRQNQNAYWWENAEGKRLLVWNGEHYNLGNVLGFKPNHVTNFMQDSYLGGKQEATDSVEELYQNLLRYLDECEEQGYVYNFIISSVSGVFSDNAPPEVEILETIEEYNRRYKDEVEVKMVSLQELYEVIKDEFADAPVFTILRLRYTMEGSVHTEVGLKFFHEIPRVDFSLELGKTISSDIESVYLPLELDFEDRSLYLRKGTEAFRPGVDQISGTCMEFYMSDEGLGYVSPQGGAMIAMYDTPLVYMGEMEHHPIRLCEGCEADNKRPVYSWVMNNIWETNFKMDLSGFSEFKYSLWLSDEQNPEKMMDQLREAVFAPHVLIVE